MKLHTVRAWWQFMCAKERQHVGPSSVDLAMATCSCTDPLYIPIASLPPLCRGSVASAVTCMCDCESTKPRSEHWRSSMEWMQ